MINIVEYTIGRVPDALDFEKRLRAEEADFCWDIGEAYERNVRKSFESDMFKHSISLLAYINAKVAGRIDSTLICSHFDGSVKAYLDWICVIKSARHKGVARALMRALRARLRADYGVDTLIGLIAGNAEAQRFYRALKNSKIRDEGVWIDC